MSEHDAEFEKHTTGFGSKMLRKMGYKKVVRPAVVLSVQLLLHQGSGLGRNEDGMLESLGATAKNWSHQGGLSSGNAASVHRAKRRQTDSVSACSCSTLHAHLMNDPGDPRNQSRPRTADIAVPSASPDFEQLRSQSEMRVSNVRALVSPIH